ncbi:MAG: heparinase II/III family protein [Spirosomataceae bacterium]
MKKIFFVLGLFFVHQSFAQVAQRNILGTRYNLSTVQAALIPKNQWKPYPKTPTEWQAVVPDSVVKQVIKSGEKALSYHFESISATVSLDFVRSGDRERHGKISYGKRNALTELILAESMEGRGRFMEAIMNGIWSICEESYWGVPAHIRGTGLPDVENPVVDLFSAETASVMAIADYFVGEKLDGINKLIRKRMYYETNQRIFVPMLKNGDSYGWMSKTRPVNNWNPWIMSNWMMSTLLLEKDENRRAEMLYKSMLGLDRYLNSLGDDGGCDEGPSYWFAAGASVYDCLELLQRSTNNAVMIYNEPLIQKMASYVYKAHIDGHYFTNFADADPKLRPDGLLLYRFGKALNDNTMLRFGQWANYTFPSAAVTGYQRMRRIENLLTIQQIGKYNYDYQPVKEAWISDIQVMVARASNGLYLATHGGHNDESHNHNDVGDFIIYNEGQPMIVDAGRGNYTARTFSNQRYELWFTQSEYHNLPIINEIGQKAGREFEAKNVKCTLSDKEASLVMDLSAAYPKNAGVSALNRVVKLNRAKNIIEVTDDYQLSEKLTSLKHAFITICDIDLSQPGKAKLTGVNNTKLTLTYDPKLWSISTEKPSTEGMEYSSFKTKWDGRSVTRILLTSQRLDQKGKYSFTFDKN